jgi:hypothetical protein
MGDDDGKRTDALRGASRLAVHATKEVTTVVEDMHRTIASGPALLGRPFERPARLGTRLVYGTVRAVTDVVGIGLDAGLAQLEPALGETSPGPQRDALVAALNGVVGDHLEQTGNPLATTMQLRQDGHPMRLEADALGSTVQQPQRRLLITVHGSCMNDRQWRHQGHDHAEALAPVLDATRLDLLYNSGRHIADNGRDLAALLERLIRCWPVPVESIVVLAHSMGGLVMRSACHFGADHAWRASLEAIVFLGTPHHGAPLERGGNVFQVLLGWHRYSAPLVRLARLRSAGVTDLRFGTVLPVETTDRFAHRGDPRPPLPLPGDVRCFAVAGTVTRGPLKDGVGDGLVPVDSALGRHADPAHTLAFPTSHTLVVDGVGHLELLSDATVYAALCSWLFDGAAAQPSA